MGEEASKKAQAIGINHIALEVEDVEAALEFYGSLFDLKLRGRHDGMAFIDLGDQFINLSPNRSQEEDRARHFGLVVDNRELLREALVRIGVKILPGRGLDFIDPWGNHVQVVQYQDIQFSKAPNVLRGMGLGRLSKTPEALAELEEKGMASEKCNPWSLAGRRTYAATSRLGRATRQRRKTHRDSLHHRGLHYLWSVRAGLSGKRDQLR